MNKIPWRFGAILVVVSLALAACVGVEPNQVICQRNPAAVAPNEAVCRPNSDTYDQSREIRVPALAIGQQQRAIYFGWAEDEKPILIDQIGAHPYPASQAIILPLQVQDFRTDNNPDGEFCAGQKPRCIAPLGNLTLEYTGGDGQVRTMANVTLNVVGSLRFVVDNNTASAWLSLERARVSEDFWYKFWDRVRTPKILSIVESGVDPVSDQWGEATNQALAAALTARLTSWDLANLTELTNGVLTVKSVDIPTSQEVGTNVDVQATQMAAELKSAEAYATQRAVICQDMTDETACAWQMQNFKGGQNSPQIIVQPPAAIVPENTPTP